VESLGERIGRQIRERRQRARYSQLALAERANLSLNHIGLLERGERLPRLETLQRVARALQADVGELVGLPGGTRG
jgi:transcriptional regulator with XRE-family HTH domain